MTNELFPNFATDKKCGQCNHIRRRKFDGGTVLHYCSIKYGHNDAEMMRVKCRDYACGDFEEREER